MIKRFINRHPDVLIWVGAIVVMIVFWPVTLWRLIKYSL